MTSDFQCRQRTLISLSPPPTPHSSAAHSPPPSSKCQLSLPLSPTRKMSFTALSLSLTLSLQIQGALRTRTRGRRLLLRLPPPLLRQRRERFSPLERFSLSLEGREIFVQRLNARSLGRRTQAPKRHRQHLLHRLLRDELPRDHRIKALRRSTPRHSEPHPVG